MAEWTCKGGTEKGVGRLQGYVRFSFRSASTQDTYWVLKDSGELACDDWQPRLCGWLLNGESGVCGSCANVEGIAQIDFADMPDMQRIGWGCFGTINQVPTFSCSSKDKCLLTWCI